MQIDIDLGDRKSIKKGVSDIKKLAKKIESFTPNLVKEEAKVASALYRDARANINGQERKYPNDVIVSTKISDDECTITARGKDVGFIEYGAGTQAISDARAPFPTGQGSWSILHAKQFARKGYWVYKRRTLKTLRREKYYAVYPTRAMHTVIEDLERDTVGKAKKYFG